MSEAEADAVRAGKTDGIDRTFVVIRGARAAFDAASLEQPQPLKNLQVQFCMNIRALHLVAADGTNEGEPFWYYHCFDNAKQPDFTIAVNSTDFEADPVFAVTWGGVLHFSHPDDPKVIVDLHENHGGASAVVAE